MTITHSSTAMQASLRLHQYMTAHQWHDGALTGPDPGVRFNYRLFRFIKSYLRFIPWQDALYYAQAQGYWMLGNAALYARAGDDAYLEIAAQCADTLLDQQRADGAWEYTNPEWIGRVATAEGAWGAIGLLETYRHTQEPRYLEAVWRWHAFMTETTGYQELGETLAVNYFASRPRGRIPNNSAFVLRMLAELADVTGDQSVLEPCAGMIAFMREVQTAEGEFPYQVPGPGGGDDMPHFQCTQYNAFQCLDLMRTHELGESLALPGNEALPDLIANVLRFLSARQNADGSAHYKCGEPGRTVVYHTAVLAATFQMAGTLGFDGYAERAAQAYAYVLGKQRRDGSFPHSYGDYGFLSDQRAYPRYLAMILYHLMHVPA